MGGSPRSEFHTTVNCAGVDTYQPKQILIVKWERFLQIKSSHPVTFSCILHSKALFAGSWSVIFSCGNMLFSLVWQTKLQHDPNAAIPHIANLFNISGPFFTSEYSGVWEWTGTSTVGSSSLEIPKSKLSIFLEDTATFTRL